MTVSKLNEPRRSCPAPESVQQMMSASNTTSCLAFLLAASSDRLESFCASLALLSSCISRTRLALNFLISSSSAIVADAESPPLAANASCSFCSTTLLAS